MNFNINKNNTLTLSEYISSKRKNESISSKSLNKISMKIYEIKNTHSYCDFLIKMESAKSELLNFKSVVVESEISNILNKEKFTSTAPSISECKRTSEDLKSFSKLSLKRFISKFKSESQCIQPEDTLTDIVILKKNNTNISDKTMGEINKRVNLAIVGKSKNEAVDEIVKIQDIFVEGQLKPAPHEKIISKLNEKIEKIEKIKSQLEPTSYPSFPIFEEIKSSEELVNPPHLYKIKKQISGCSNYQENNVYLNHLPQLEDLKGIIQERLKNMHISKDEMKKISRDINELETNQSKEVIGEKLHIINKLMILEEKKLDKKTTNLYLNEWLSFSIESLSTLVRVLSKERDKYLSIKNNF